MSIKIFKVLHDNTCSLPTPVFSPFCAVFNRQEFKNSGEVTLNGDLVNTFLVPVGMANCNILKSQLV